MEFGSFLSIADWFLEIQSHQDPGSVRAAGDTRSHHIVVAE